MKKILKTLLIIIGLLICVIAVDTLQAKIFNNSPFIRIRDYYDGGNLYYIDKGIIVDSYRCSDNNNYTIFKWNSYACSSELLIDNTETVENTQVFNNDIFSDYYEEAEVIMSSMTISEKVGQMFLARMSKDNVEEEITTYSPGGYVLFQSDFANETKESILEKLESYQSISNINLFFAVDEEGGDVVRISAYKAFRDTPFESPQELWNEGGIDRIVENTIEKSTLLKSLGINMNLAPVADISTNSEDYIYSRTLGLGAEETSSYVASVVTTMSDYNMISVLKHFPGYGNNLNTHTGISIDEREYSSFENSDFLPFIAGILAGAPVILVSHNMVISMDTNYPASLSKNVHDILRQNLGFSGLIITDDISMAGITEYVSDTEALVLAVNSGNDMIITSNFEEDYNILLNAVKTAEVDVELIDTAVRRIISCKLAYGII